MRYCLKDVGSKFGTFVECRSAVCSDLRVGRSFLIGDAEVEILYLEMNNSNISNNINNNISNINNSKKAPTFDLKVRIDREKEISFVNRVSVTIGKKSSSDIKIESSCMCAKIYIGNVDNK